MCAARYNILSESTSFQQYMWSRDPSLENKRETFWSSKEHFMASNPPDYDGMNDSRMYYEIWDSSRADLSPTSG